MEVKEMGMNQNLHEFSDLADFVIFKSQHDSFLEIDINLRGFQF